MRLLYFIASVNRSGSSWLCQLLTSTGVVGEPGEIKSNRKEEQFQLNRKTDPYGPKLQLEAMRRIWRVMTDEEKATAKWVYLRREDKIRHACSLYRAQTTGVWHLRADGRKAGRVQRHNRVEYDRDGIQRRLRTIERRYEQWDQWFTRRTIEPFRLTYERLCSEPELCIREVVAFLGRSYSGAVAGHTCVMRDAITEEWAARLGKGLQT
jgi:LPS sulfotransferase NodH